LAGYNNSTPSGFARSVSFPIEFDRDGLPQDLAQPRRGEMIVEGGSRPKNRTPKG